MKRTYFMTMKLTSGEFVDVVYKSASRKGTEPHFTDLFCAAYYNDEATDIDWDYKYNRDTSTFAYIMNEKNKYEQCFGEHRIIDVR